MMEGKELPPSSTHALSDELLPILGRHGVSPNKIQNSSLSNSRYMTFAHPDHEDEANVRISDHVAKPTYEKLNGVPDVEIGAHDMGQSVLSGAHSILNKIGVSPDKQLHADLAKEKEEQTARFDKKPNPVATAFDENNDAVKNWAKERWSDSNSTSGKNKRRALRREYSERASADHLRDTIKSAMK
jgi:hypothetical protein